MHARPCSLLLCVAPLAVFGPGPAAARHPLADSTAAALPLAPEGEWDFLAVDPARGRVFVGDYCCRIAVLDAETEALLGLWALPDDEYLGGLAVLPDGSLLAATQAALYRFDEHGVVVDTLPGGETWRAGQPLLPPGAEVSRLYVVTGDEVFVVDRGPTGLRFEDLDEAEDGVQGLLALHPDWYDWVQGSLRRGFVDSGGDRLILVDDQAEAEETTLVIVEGLTPDPRGATLRYVGVPNPLQSDAPAQLVPADEVFYDSFGNVWSAAEPRPLQPVDFGASTGFLPATLARSTDGAWRYYEGWAGDVNTWTFAGETVLVVDATGAVLDLDEDPANGLTGIDLSAAADFTTGAFSFHESALSPDGRRLFLAVGSDTGVLVVRLNHDAAQTPVVQPRVIGDRGEVTLRIGGAWPDGTPVELLGPEGLRFASSESRTLPGRTALEVLFPSGPRSVGPYDLRVRPAGGADVFLPGAVTVEAARDTLSLDLLGDARLVSVGEVTVSLVVTNTGNVDVADLIVALEPRAPLRTRLHLPAAHPWGTDHGDADFTDLTPEAPQHLLIGRLRARQAYTFDLAVAGPSDRPVTDWDVAVQVTLKRFQGRLPRKAVGDLCDAGDAVVEAIGDELAERGNAVPGEVLGDALADVTGRAMVNFGVAKLEDVAAETLGGLVVLAILPPALPLYVIVYEAIDALTNCWEFLTKLLSFEVLFARDPNDKVSTTGLDGFLRGDETLRYRVRFENVAGATAEAQTVIVTDRLDEALDPETFALTSTSHPDRLVVDRDGAALTFTFNDLALPPNETPPEGEGFVEFTARLRPGLPDGTVVRNTARIVFDLNAPLDTPEVRHVIDRSPPETTATPLPERLSGTAIPLEFTADDGAGVGLWDFDVSRAVDDGDFAPWLRMVRATSVVAAGEVGHRHRFRITARDRLDNRAASAAEVATTLVAPDGGRDAGLDGSVDGGLDGGLDGGPTSGGGCGCHVGGRPASTEKALLAAALGLGLAVGLRRRRAWHCRSAIRRVADARPRSAAAGRIGASGSVLCGGRRAALRVVGAMHL